MMTCSLFACGDTAGAGGGAQCMDGAKSMPGMAKDPCPQTGTMCAATAGHAVACCAGTMWAKNAMGTINCQCETATHAVTCAAGGFSCGNGVIDTASGEQCDGMMLGATGTCMALGMGMGVLSCDPSTCRYDTSMCAGATPTGGTSGGGGTGS